MPHNSALEVLLWPRTERLLGHKNIHRMDHYSPRIQRQRRQGSVHDEIWQDQVLWLQHWVTGRKTNDGGPKEYQCNSKEVFIFAQWRVQTSGEYLHGSCPSRIKTSSGSDKTITWWIEEWYWSIWKISQFLWHWSIWTIPHFLQSVAPLSQDWERIKVCCRQTKWLCQRVVEMKNLCNICGSRSFNSWWNFMLDFLTSIFRARC